MSDADCHAQQLLILFYGLLMALMALLLLSLDGHFSRCSGDGGAPAQIRLQPAFALAHAWRRVARSARWLAMPCIRARLCHCGCCGRFSIFKAWRQRHADCRASGRHGGAPSPLARYCRFYIAQVSQAFSARARRFWPSVIRLLRERR